MEDGEWIMDDESTSNLMDANDESDIVGIPQPCAAWRSSSGTTGLIHSAAGFGVDVAVGVD